MIMIQSAFITPDKTLDEAENDVAFIKNVMYFYYPQEMVTW